MTLPRLSTPVFTRFFVGGHVATSRGEWTAVHRTEASTATRRQLTRIDYFGIGLAVLLIFAVALVNGRNRIFWEDETLGWVLLRDPSWRHMIHAWKLGADGGGIFFYVLGSAWFRVFGDSIVAYRLFSATTFGLAVPVLWSALRRYYTAGVVAFAIFNTFFFSPPLTMHFMEGRFYGLLMLATALAFAGVLALDQLGNGSVAPLQRRWYAITFLTHLLLTGTHVLGILYSAILVLALVLLDQRRGRRRPGLYLAAVSSWALLLFERTALRATAAVGHPHFWTKAPNAGQVIGAFVGFSAEIFVALFLLFVLAVSSLPRDLADLRFRVLTSFRSRRAVYLAAGCLFLVPFVLLLEGQFGTWLFTDRYLQPLAIAIASLTAELCHYASRSFRFAGKAGRWTPLRRFAPAVFAAAFLALLTFWVFRHEAHFTPSVPDFTARLSDEMPNDAPVVVEDAFTFTELMSRPAGSSRRYTFLLDWPYALNPQSPRMAVTQFHLMQNWQRSGYFAANIVERNAFLRDHPKFYVVSNSILGDRPADRPEQGDPIALEFTHTPNYETRQLFVLDRLHDDNQRDTVWLVCRKACA